MKKKKKVSSLIVKGKKKHVQLDTQPGEKFIHASLIWARKGGDEHVIFVCEGGSQSNQQFLFLVFIPFSIFFVSTYSRKKKEGKKNKERQMQFESINCWRSGNKCVRAPQVFLYSVGCPFLCVQRAVEIKGCCCCCWKKTCVVSIAVGVLPFPLIASADGNMSLLSCPPTRGRK